MTLPPFDHDALTAAVAQHGGVFGSGPGADIDAAFDAAVTLAFDHPSAGPSLISADPGNLTQAADPTSVDAAAAAALAWLVDHPGDATVAAFPVLGRAAHTRTTRRSVIDGVEHEVDTSPAGRWSAFTGSLAAAVAEAGGGPVEGEVLEQVTVTRRARYKPVTVPNRDKSAGQFAVIDGDRILSRGHATRSEAQKAAVAEIKAMAADDHSPRRLEVYKLGGREGGRALVEVLRTRVRQTLRIKAVYAAAKETTKPAKVTGWFFVTAAHPTSPAPAPEATPAVPDPAQEPAG